MKKSFTLIEVLISVTILSIIFFYLSGFLKNLNKTADVMNSLSDSRKAKETVLKVLYYDLLNADKVSLEQKKNKTYVKLSTSNSLHGMAHPYVYWYVKKGALIRAETPKEYNVSMQNGNYYLDKLALNVKIFKIYKNNGKYFVYLDDKKPIYFEMYKGF